MGGCSLGRAVDAVDRAGAAIGARWLRSRRPMSVAEAGPLRAVGPIRQAAPGGGSFDRFDVAAQPIVAPVNARGQVAFYATVLHAPGTRGHLPRRAGRVTKVAAFGDAVPGGGTLADFAAHPLPALNAAGHVAFDAQIAGGRATEGIFLAGDDGLQAWRWPATSAGRARWACWSASTRRR